MSFGEMCDVAGAGDRCTVWLREALPKETGEHGGLGRLREPISADHRPVTRSISLGLDGAR